MNIPDPPTFTTLVWWTTLCVAVVDTFLILAIWRFLPTGDFLRMNRWVLLISFAFYTLLWSSVQYFAWDGFYGLGRKTQCLQPWDISPSPALAAFDRN